MAAKWDLASSTSYASPACTGEPIHLDDGTMVFLAFTSGQLLNLYYVTSAGVATLINTVPTGTSFSAGRFFVGYDYVDKFRLVRDAANNIFVFGDDGAGGTVLCQAYVKGAGYTWTQKSTVSSNLPSNASSAMIGMQAVWCNLGGTGGHGLIFCTYYGGNGNMGFFVVDVGNGLLNGTALILLNYGANPAFAPAYAGSGIPRYISLAQDGFGAAAGLCMTAQTQTVVYLGSWAINSAGTLTTSTVLANIPSQTLSNASPTTGISRFRVRRVSSGSFAVVVSSTSVNGVWDCYKYSLTAAIGAKATAPVNTINDPHNSITAKWDVFSDGISGILYLITQDPNTTTTIKSIKCNCVGAPAWDAAYATVDTVVGTSAGDTMDVLNCVPMPIGSKADFWVRDTSNSHQVGDWVTLSASYSAAISNSIPTTESVSRALAVSRSMSDTIATTQSMATLKSAGVLLANSIPTTEAMARTITVARALINSIPTTDALTRTSSRAFALSNSIPFGSDVLAVVINRGRSFVTTLTLSESISRSMNNVRSLIDTIPTTDAILYVWQGLYPSIVGIDMERQDNVQIFIVDRFGTRYGELPGATIKNPKWVLNDTETCELDFINVDPGLVKVLLLQRELQIVWNDVINSETGYPEMMWLMVGAKKGKPGTSTRSCEGLLSWFKSRIVETATLTYNDVDQLDIAWGLLQTAQTGVNYDRNVGASYAPSGRHRYREYARNQHKIIYDALKEFSTLEGGFDHSIEVDPTGRRMWTPWYPSKGTYKPQYALEWERNVVDYEINEAGWGVRTKLYEVGASDGVIQFEASYEDAAASGAYGAMVGVETNSGEKDVDWLADKAQKSVEKKKAPIKTVSVTAKNTPVQLFGNIHTGDVVPCRIDDSDNYVNEDLRIKTLEWVDPQTLQLELIEPGTS